MNIGVSSYSFAKYMKKTGATYPEICTLAKEMGYEGIEFVELHLLRPVGDTAKEALAIRAHCEAIDLPIIAYTVGADFLEDAGKAKAHVKACVDTAALLGAPLVRHDATWSRDTQDWRAAIRQMTPAIYEVAAYAEAKGIRTCTENHGYFIQDSNRVEELMLSVNHPNYGWLVDIGNFACADEDSIHALETAVHYAFHVHAKDFLIKPADGEDPGEGWFRSRLGRYLRGTVVGHGEVPIARCIRMLREAGYDGWLSYEFEGMEDTLDALKAGISYLKRIIA